MNDDLNPSPNVDSPQSTDGLHFVARQLPISRVAAIRHCAYEHGRVIEGETFSVLGFGSATSILLPRGVDDAECVQNVATHLERIRNIDDSSSAPGRLPIALGALPFSRSAACELIVPSVTVLTHAQDPPIGIAVARKEHLPRMLATFPFHSDAGPFESAAQPSPDSYSLISSRSHDDFRSRMRLAIDAIRTSPLEKVVLAREVVVKANCDFVVSELLERIRVLHPSCTAFSIDGFIGASPELLCEKIGSHIHAHPLAGTVARSGDQHDDERLANALLNSPKERSEHRFVVDYIANAFAALSEGVRIDGPHVLELRNVAHLATAIDAELAMSTRISAFELACVLHPTPAVAGTPTDEALTYIQNNEDLDRERYAGPVGYVSANGDGQWWLGIRSATIEGAVARLCAGVGIVESSDPETELIETQLKLQALLAVAVRP